MNPLTQGLVSCQTIPPLCRPSPFHSGFSLRLGESGTDGIEDPQGRHEGDWTPLLGKGGLDRLPFSACISMLCKTLFAASGEMAIYQDRPRSHGILASVVFILQHRIRMCRLIRGSAFAGYKRLSVNNAAAEPYSNRQVALTYSF